MTRSLPYQLVSRRISGCHQQKSNGKKKDNDENNPTAQPPNLHRYPESQLGRSNNRHWKSMVTNKWRKKNGEKFEITGFFFSAKNTWQDCSFEILKAKHRGSYLSLERERRRTKQSFNLKKPSILSSGANREKNKCSCHMSHEMEKTSPWNEITHWFIGSGFTTNIISFWPRFFLPTKSVRLPKYIYHFTGFSTFLLLKLVCVFSLFFFVFQLCQIRNWSQEDVLQLRFLPWRRSKAEGGAKR